MNYSVLNLCLCIDIQIQLCIVFHCLSFELIRPLQWALSAHCTSLSQDLIILSINALPGNTEYKVDHNLQSAFLTDLKIRQFDKKATQNWTSLRNSKVPHSEVRSHIGEPCRPSAMATPENHI